MSAYDHREGYCFTCGEIKQVRYKNLYITGSEGVKLCMPCELKVVEFVRNLAVEAHKEKIKEFKAKKNII